MKTETKGTLIKSLSEKVNSKRIRHTTVELTTNEKEYSVVVNVENKGKVLVGIFLNDKLLKTHTFKSYTIAKSEIELILQNTWFYC